MDLHCPVKQWTKAIWFALLVTVAGCSEAVLLTHETETGGVVTYLFKEDRGGPIRLLQPERGAQSHGEKVSVRLHRTQRRRGARLWQYVQYGRVKKGK